MLGRKEPGFCETIRDVMEFAAHTPLQVMIIVIGCLISTLGIIYAIKWFVRLL